MLCNKQSRFRYDHSIIYALLKLTKEIRLANTCQGLT